MIDLIIKETEKEDLENVQKLWNDGDVTKYVGFPNGIGVTYEDLEKWHVNLQNWKMTKHYSIYHAELGYCGESFYSVDAKNDLGMLDIKLFSFARGKGIARYSLEYAIKQVFDNNYCSRVYVDPSTENKKAWALYEKIGFKSQTRPEFLEPSDIYLELTKEDFQKQKDK